MTFGRRRNGFFTDDPLSFFVVSGFGSFWSDHRWGPELIRDLPVERRPVADQMDVAGWGQAGASGGGGLMHVIECCSLPAFFYSQQIRSSQRLFSQQL